MTFNEYANQSTAPSSGDFMSISALALAVFSRALGNSEWRCFGVAAAGGTALCAGCAALRVASRRHEVHLQCSGSCLDKPLACCFTALSACTGARSHAKLAEWLWLLS